MSEQDYYNRYWGEGVAGWCVEAGLTAPMRDLLVQSTAGRDVLDFGGGNGERYGQVLRDNAKSSTVADVSTAVLSHRADAGDDVLHVSDLAAHQGQYDVVLYLEVLEHLLDPVEALKLGTSTLRPDGFVLVSVPNAFSWWNRLRMLVGRLPASGVGPPGVRGRTYLAPHIRFFDLRSLTGAMEAAGLEVEGAWTDSVETWRFERYAKPRLRRLSLQRESPLLARTLIAKGVRKLSPGRDA